MNFQKGFRLFWILGLLCVSPAVRAATVIYTSGQVSAIDGLTVDGAEYNVTFDAYVPDLTFLNNVNGANDAVNAIDTALDVALQNGATFISTPPSGSAQYFEVSDALPAPNVSDVILGELTYQAPNLVWVNEGPFQSYPAGYDNAYAQFAPVPEPSAGQLLLVAGLTFVPYGFKRLSLRSSDSRTAFGYKSSRR